MIDAFNPTSTEIPRGLICAADDPNGVTAAPSAAGGSALSITGLSEPPKTRPDGLTRVYPLPLLFLLSGTWAACKLTVKSGRGDFDIDVAAGTTGAVTTGAEKYLHTDVTEIVTDVDPGAAAQLEIRWLCPQCIKLVGNDRPYVVTANPIRAGGFQSAQESPGATVAVDVSDDAHIEVGDEVYILPTGKVRELRAGDAAGWKMANAQRLSVGEPGKRVTVPIAFRPIKI